METIYVSTPSGVVIKKGYKFNSQLGYFKLSREENAVKEWRVTELKSGMKVATCRSSVACESWCLNPDNIKKVEEATKNNPDYLDACKKVEEFKKVYLK